MSCCEFTELFFMIHRANLKKQSELKMKHTDRNVHHETDFIRAPIKHGVWVRDEGLHYYIFLAK
jgi:hypothetical protein